MRKMGIICIMLGLLFYKSLCLEASENENADVIITNLSYEEEFTKQFEVNVKVQFEDESLYNDDVYLSYHVYDALEENLLKYENQRIKIKLDENSQMVCTLAIDLTEVMKNADAVVVKYDIVDQANLFWFADNPEVKFSTVKINCELDWGMASLRTLKNGVTTHPLIFSINLIVTISVVGLILYLRKKISENK